jgi:hypothetical protein
LGVGFTAGVIGQSRPTTISRPQFVTGVMGLGDSGAGVYGGGGSGPGVQGDSLSADGVLGVSQSNQHAGVSAINDQGGFGLWARGKVAGHFEGDVEVTGDIRLLGGQDCAEEFDVAEDVQPGSVVVLDGLGHLCLSRRPFDTKVAGVVSGAGSLRPGLTLKGHCTGGRRAPIALFGRVFCFADAEECPIQTGDLLTTARRPGFAMRVSNRRRAVGAILGKALAPLGEGTALIPILVTLQ